MGNYPITGSPGRDAVFEDVAGPAGTYEFNQVQAAALAEVTAAMQTGHEHRQARMQGGAQ